MAANQLPVEVELAPQAGLNIPNGLNVPDGVFEQPAPPPQPTFCDRHENQFKVLFLFLIIVSFFIGGWLGLRKAHRHHPHPSYLCRLATTVALDGSGNFTSISRAVQMAPISDDMEYCIFIKPGVYREDVLINKTQTNIVLIGEGVGETIVAGGNHNNETTLEVFGDGFIAKDIAFESSLGPKRNATAAYIVADKCVFHSCSFEGNQSALHAIDQRQFFKDCMISGSTSVISGGATAVFQNCTIFVGQPVGKKDNIISSQGGHNIAAGFIFQSCRMLSRDNTQVALHHTFIASPLGHYSRVIVMRSYMAGLINPAGWITGNDSSEFYGEFQNSGPGAATSRRVRSSEINFLSHSEASNFTVKHVLEYDEEWLDSTGVRYWDDLDQIPQQQ